MATSMSNNELATGGTTGLILADRLSESGDEKVLVLEAGPDPNVVAMHQAPGAVEYIAGKMKCKNKSFGFLNRSRRYGDRLELLYGASRRPRWS
jgi:choline dehydrogenase-like flavoprotein